MCSDLDCDTRALLAGDDVTAAASSRRRRGRRHLQQSTPAPPFAAGEEPQTTSYVDSTFDFADGSAAHVWSEGEETYTTHRGLLEGNITALADAMERAATFDSSNQGEIATAVKLAEAAADSSLVLERSMASFAGRGANAGEEGKAIGVFFFYLQRWSAAFTPLCRFSPRSKAP